MTDISIVIVTSGNNDAGLNQIIDSIEILSIPNYEVVLVGGLTTTINRKNVIHIPFDESEIAPGVWLTKKKNLGVKHSKYEVVVVMHDYHVFDSDWYEEFEKFGTDWDICIQQQFTMEGERANGWRAGPIPGYPEIPPCMTIPWDIDCFIPYMAIQGAYWVTKKHVMLETPLDENLELTGASDSDIEWSSRVVPGWLGQKFDQTPYRIVSNPKCITRFNKYKPPYPGNPNFAKMEINLQWLWDALREGGRRNGVYHYERSMNKVLIR